jgi:hypothetical protein
MSTHIGKHSFSSKADLIDVIVHEELHHRWWDKGIVDHHPEAAKLLRPLTDAEALRGTKFYATIARYKRLKGLSYRQEHIDDFYRLLGIK